LAQADKDQNAPCSHLCLHPPALEECLCGQARSTKAPTHSRPTAPIATIMMTIPGVVALALGTLYGLGLTAGPGLSKLLPAHPLHKLMKDGFHLLIGPFYGVPGDLFRIVLGIADSCAGVGLLVALWGEFLGLLGPGGPGTLLELAQSLIICACIGSGWINANAVAFDAAVGGDWKPSLVLALVAAVLLACRLMVTDRVLPLLVGGFVGACLLMLAVSLTCRGLYGTPLKEAREKHAEFQKIMEAEMAGPGASTEPLAKPEA